MNLQARSFPHLNVPRILPFLSNAILELYGQSSEGIFRVPGDADYVTELVSMRTGAYGIMKYLEPAYLK